MTDLIGRQTAELDARYYMRLATNGVLGETEAMESMGVDPHQYLVVPRVVGERVGVGQLPRPATPDKDANVREIDEGL